MLSAILGKKALGALLIAIVCSVVAAATLSSSWNVNQQVLPASNGGDNNGGISEPMAKLSGPLKVNAIVAGSTVDYPLTLAISGNNTTVDISIIIKELNGSAISPTAFDGSWSWNYDSMPGMHFSFVQSAPSIVTGHVSSQIPLPVGTYNCDLKILWSAAGNFNLSAEVYI